MLCHELAGAVLTPAVRAQECKAALRPEERRRNLETPGEWYCLKCGRRRDSQCAPPPAGLRQGTLVPPSLQTWATKAFAPVADCCTDHFSATPWSLLRALYGSAASGALPAGRARPAIRRACMCEEACIYSWRDGRANRWRRPAVGLRSDPVRAVQRPDARPYHCSTRQAQPSCQGNIPLHAPTGRQRRSPSGPMCRAGPDPAAPLKRIG